MDFYELGRQSATSFFKLAAPRWVKEFEGLSPSGQATLLRMGARARDVRPLGVGGERIADLVVHPQHGLVVRKVPFIRQTDPRHVKPVEAYAAEQRQMERRLKELAGGAGPFAHILGEGSKGEAYYQYAPGQRQDAALASRFELQKKQLARARKAFNRMDATLPEGVSAYSRPEGQNVTSAENTLAEMTHALQAPGRLPADANGPLEQLRKEYPEMHDIRGANIVGDRLVDISPVRRSITHYWERSPSKLPAVAISKRHYLGTGKTVR